MLNENEIYHQDVLVGDSLVTARGTLRLSRFLSLIQEAAIGGSAYAGAGVEKVKELNLYWVVMRYHFAILRMPKVGERVRFWTYPGAPKSFVYPRFFVVEGANKEVLIRGSSLWALLSRLSHKPSPADQNHLPTASDHSEDDQLAWPSAIALSSLTLLEERPIRHSDMDFNGHMNNVRYLDFALDAMPMGYFEEHPIISFQIQYSSECHSGEKMDLYAAQEATLYSFQGKVGERNVFALQISTAN